jgi:hypothetical protein
VERTLTPRAVSIILAAEENFWQNSARGTSSITGIGALPGQVARSSQYPKLCPVYRIFKAAMNGAHGISVSLTDRTHS